MSQYKDFEPKINPEAVEIMFERRALVEKEKPLSDQAAQMIQRFGLPSCAEYIECIGEDEISHNSTSVYMYPDGRIKYVAQAMGELDLRLRLGLSTELDPKMDGRTLYYEGQGMNIIVFNLTVETPDKLCLPISEAIDCEFAIFSGVDLETGNVVLYGYATRNEILRARAEYARNKVSIN